MKAELYDLDAKLRYARNSLEKSNLSEENKELIKEFELERLAENKSEHRVATDVSHLARLGELINFNLENASREEVMEVARRINRDEIGDERHSVWTLCEYKKALNNFYRWHTGVENPELTNFLSVHPKESEKPKIQPEELLDVEMVEKFINAASNPRDKVFLGMLWDSGARISELLNLTWKDIVFKDDLMAVHIRHGKNGPRKLYLIESIPLVKNWMNWCAQKGKSMDPDDPVFTVYRPYRSNDNLTYRNARKQIKTIRERIDIPDRVKSNPHAWRKARATHVAGNGMNQPNMNKWFGWVPGSDAAKYYIMLAAQDLERGVRDMYPGIDELEEERSKFLGENIPMYDQSDLRAYYG